MVDDEKNDDEQTLQNGNNGNDDKGDDAPDVKVKSAVVDDVVDDDDDELIDEQNSNYDDNDDDDEDDDEQLIDASDLIDSISCVIAAVDGNPIKKKARAVLFGDHLRVSTRLRRVRKRIPYSTIERLHVDRQVSSINDATPTQKAVLAAGNVSLCQGRVVLHIEYGQHSLELTDIAPHESSDETTECGAQVHFILIFKNSQLY